MQGDAVPLPDIEPDIVITTPTEHMHGYSWEVLEAALRAYGDSRAEHARREAMEEAAKECELEIRYFPLEPYQVAENLMAERLAKIIRRAATKGATPPRVAQGDGS